MTILGDLLPCLDGHLLVKTMFTRIDYGLKRLMIQKEKIATKKNTCHLKN